MNFIKKWEDQDVTALLKATFDRHEIVLSSTDTILGLLGTLAPESFKALSLLKGARENKPYIILIGKTQGWETFVDTDTVTRGMRNVIEHCWPGPLTIIFKAKKDLPPHMVAPDGTIALRYPAHIGLQKILKNYDGLFSTSANKSNQPPPVTLENVDQDICSRVALCVVDVGSHITEKNLPSTILNFSECTKLDNPEQPCKVKVVREGAYSIKELERFYGARFT